MFKIFCTFDCLSSIYMEIFNVEFASALERDFLFVLNNRVGGRSYSFGHAFTKQTLQKQ